MTRVLILFLLLGLVLPAKLDAVRQAGLPAEGKLKGGKAMVFQVVSFAFGPNEMIPVKYTGDGEDISPPLVWHDPPAGTKSFALINDDPDAPSGDWVHWLLFNISSGVKELPAGLTKAKLKGAKQGKNSFGRLDYGGPSPPPGKPHRYFFKIYALDAMLGLPEGANKREILRAMEGHVLAGAQLIGLYKR